MPTTKLPRWCVMVSGEMYPDSMSRTRDGAESYLDDAKHAATPGARVFVAEIEVVSRGAVYVKPTNPKARANQDGP